MNEDAHNIFVSGIRHFDDFVTSINDMNPQQSSFSRYPNFDVLKKDLSSYAAFLQFRKDFIGKYSSTVYESYETLFKEQKYLDKFFYESLLIKMKSL